MDALSGGSRAGGAAESAGSGSGRREPVPTGGRSAGALPGSPGPGPDVEFPGGDRELRSAMALSGARGVALERLRRVLDRVGSAAAVVEEGAGRVAWRACLQSDEREVLGALDPEPAERLARLRERGVRVVSYRGPGYPRRLLHLHQPPPALYLEGPLRLEERSVAVVGTRSATSYGRRAARDLAGDLARAGWIVVSGLARGIDAAAHGGALDAGGRTAAVLGSGLDHRYPASNRELYERLAERGLLVTEFPPEQPPRKWTFPKRNRIIAALSAGVVVVQAPRRSGALITADQALELGREVFAVPGPVGAPASEGTHQLLRSGAPLAAGARDVLRVLGEAPADGLPSSGDSAGADQLELEPGIRSSLDADGLRSLWSALLDGAETLDDLEQRSGLPAGRLLALLSELELAGLVRRAAGDRYQPIPAGSR